MTFCIVGLNILKINKYYIEFTKNVSIVLKGI
jgi:hypothetical protein